MKINQFACTYMYITFVYQQIIKQDRFSLLLKFLHLNDNSKCGQPGHDPLFKVRSSLIHSSGTFKMLTTPPMSYRLTSP